MDYSKIVPQEQITKTVEALIANGMNALVVENGKEAKAKVLELIPKGSEIMDMTSETLRTIGVVDAISNSKDYNVLKPKMYSMDRKTQGREMNQMGAAHDYTIGSVHAITEKGSVFIASGTGSQLPAYAYSSDHVIWVVGAQKLVKDEEEAMKRIYSYVLPLESERARKAYGVPGSNVNKMLIINREGVPNRITVIIVKESLGF